MMIFYDLAKPGGICVQWNVFSDKLYYTKTTFLTHYMYTINWKIGIDYWFKTLIQCTTVYLYFVWNYVPYYTGILFMAPGTVYMAAD